MLHFEVVWRDCPVTVEKISPANFKFAVVKNFPKCENIVLLFIRIYMPVAEEVLLD
jgi:hypothetical protein